MLEKEKEEIYLLSPKESPLYKLLKKGQFKSFLSAIWVEDDLYPAPEVLVSKQPMQKRICPYFVACGNKYCKFYKPIGTHAKIIYCRSVSFEIPYQEEWGPYARPRSKQDGQAVELTDVDVGDIRVPKD